MYLRQHHLTDPVLVLATLAVAFRDRRERVLGSRRDRLEREVSRRMEGSYRNFEPGGPAE